MHLGKKRPHLRLVRGPLHTISKEGRWQMKANGYRWFLHGVVSALNKIQSAYGVNTAPARIAITKVEAGITAAMDKRRAK